MRFLQVHKRHLSAQEVLLGGILLLLVVEQALDKYNLNQEITIFSHHFDMLTQEYSFVYADFLGESLLDMYCLQRFLRPLRQRERHILASRSQKTDLQQHY